MSDKKLLLWDIDGTLISISYLGGEIFDRAFLRALDVKPPQRVNMSGKTDPQIVTEYLEMLNFDTSEFEAMTAEVLECLRLELAVAKEEVAKIGSPKENAEQILQYFSGSDDVIQSVLTGNIVENAKLKLNIFALDKYIDFECGAFGSDHIDRKELVGVAFERVEAKHDIAPDPRSTWIIGDSPNDFACAAASGLRCILVATGRFGFEELSRLGADLVCENLSDKEILNLIET